MKKLILVIHVIAVALFCQAQKPAHTLNKYLFNNYIQSFDYTITIKDNATTINSTSHGRDRIWELEDHFKFSYAKDSSNFSYTVTAGRTLPPSIKITNKGGKLTVLENDSIINTINDPSIDIAINMSNPLSYMPIIEKWVQLGMKKYLVVFDGFNKRNIEIKFAKDITIRNEHL